MENFLNTLKINEQQLMPKYQQLADSIIDGLEQGVLKKNDSLPSIHELAIALNISKNTVEKAYNRLKRAGLVNSFRGKGYFIKYESMVYETY